MKWLLRYTVYGYEMDLYLRIASGEYYVNVMIEKTNFGKLYGDIFTDGCMLYLFCPAEMLMYLVNLYNTRDFNGIVNSLNGLIGSNITKLKILNVEGRVDNCELLRWC